MISPQQTRQDAKRAIAVRSKTDLPKATPRGQILYISEDDKPAYSDGTNWRWFSDNTVVS